MKADSSILRQLIHMTSWFEPLTLWLLPCAFEPPTVIVAAVDLLLVPFPALAQSANETELWTAERSDWRRTCSPRLMSGRSEAAVPDLQYND